MARTLKEEEYNTKRNEILDAAQKLIYSKGYEQMSIQDILTTLHISKGAFYHYFDSKQELLHALIDWMVKDVEQILDALIHDTSLTALDKIKEYFIRTASWKTSEREIIMNYLHAWYSETNVHIRYQVTTQSVRILTWFFTPIISEGIQEKSMQTEYPEQTARILARTVIEFSDTISELLLDSVREPSAISKLDRIFNAYAESCERMLGAPQGSLHVFDAREFSAWLETK